MAAIKVEEDEMWPWFIIHDESCSYGKTVEVDEETLARWREAMSAAYAVQDEIRKFMKWDD